MPGLNGTGPIGSGPMTGRGFGYRQTGVARTAKNGVLGCGLGRGNRRMSNNYAPNAELLSQEKVVLEKRIAEIDTIIKK